jgi:ATP-dependent helicase HrpA
VAAREIFIREALVGRVGDPLPFLAHNRKLIRAGEELEHKSRRQDVLVDDELIHAFYDQQLPADVCQRRQLERWYREEVKRQPKLLQLTREELMRHEAAGITTAAFPRTMRLGGIDCAASYLHEPGDAKDGVTVTVPIYVLNQVSEERCEWLVPGMLEAKVHRAGQEPAPAAALPAGAAAGLRGRVLRLGVPFARAACWTRCWPPCANARNSPVQRNDFKLEQLAPHLFMNFRVVDEHGRQLGMGRNLAALKAELGGQARSAFQALAALKVAAAAPSPPPSAHGGESGAMDRISPSPRRGGGSGRPGAAAAASQTYTAWTFGELPELMEICARPARRWSVFRR